MSTYYKTIFRKLPLLEISFDNSHIHIIDFNCEKNNNVFLHKSIKRIEFLRNQILIDSLDKNITIDIEKHNITKAKNLVIQINKLKFSKELLWPKELYKSESFTHFKNRYDGYGKELYFKLKTENLEIFSGLKFYQKLSETEDSYAEYIDDDISFVIQLDFHSELILIWNNENIKEIGSWQTDKIKTSINFILNDFIMKF